MTQLLALQHRLPSVAWLLSELARSRRFDRIALISKPYSAISNAWPDGLGLVAELPNLDTAVQSLSGRTLLLDEGGGLHRALPMHVTDDVAGVEQTSFGARARWKCPMVLVCRSAAKLLFESQIIARGIVRKLESLRRLDCGPVGIIGLGAIGSAVARALLSRGIPVMASETQSTPADLKAYCVPVHELLIRCRTILGCTGKDCLGDVTLDRLTGRRTFISCSSSNIEFLSLLNRLPAGSAYGDRRGGIGALQVEVLNGGYPINFDRQNEWERFEEILLTRMLVLEGLKQADSLIGGRPRGVMLDPALQLRVLETWLEQVPDRESLTVPARLSEDFLRGHSEGEIEIGRMPYQLHETTPGALHCMREHVAPYDVNVLGLDFLLLPGVWSPAYDWSGQFHAENLPDVCGRDVLEIGSGCGLISVFASKRGARSITAVDVNAVAVENTRRNFERHGVRNGRCMESDCFSSVREKFDVIVWNAPFHGSAPADMLEWGCADAGYEHVRKFFKSLREHLRVDGVVLFGFSISGDIDLVQRLIVQNGLLIRRRLSDWREGYNCELFVLTVDPKSLRGQHTY